MRGTLITTLLIAVISLLGTAASVAAQASRGGIAGTVKDATGAVLPGVTVEENGPDGQSSRETRGPFSVVTLGKSAGIYTWKFSADGYLPVWRRMELKLPGRFRTHQISHEVVPPAAHHVGFIAEAVAAIGKHDEIEVFIGFDELVHDQQGVVGRHVVIHRSVR